MSFSVQRHAGDQRKLAQRFAKPLMALVDMVAEQDWERVIALADTIAQEARVELITAARPDAKQRE